MKTNISSFFNKFKNITPRKTEDDIELPSKRSNLSKPAPPKGTRINKNILIIVAFIISIILSYSFYSASYKKESIKNTEADSKKNVQTNKSSPFDELPADYAKKNTPNSPNTTTSTLPVNPNVPTNIPVPPQIPSMSREQQAAMNSRIQTAQRLEQEQEVAYRSKIGVFDKIKVEQSGKTAIQPQTTTYANAESDWDQNQQQSKSDFVANTKLPNIFNAQAIVPAISKYTVSAGSNIPCILITGINTDLPGNIIAQVSENIYDTTTGEYLLIPQGAKLVGKYDSKIVYGQYRVLLIWQRLLLPNGKSIFLENMQGADIQGFSGLRDKVDKHTPDLVRGVVLSALLSSVAMAATSSHNNDSYRNDFKVAAGQGAAQATLDVGNQITQKNLDRQPTLTIAPGHMFMVMVHVDLLMEPYK